MKKTILICALFLQVLSAQNITILPSGITPNQSGSIPKLSYDNILLLNSPQEGDLAYDLTFHLMRIFNEGKWNYPLSTSNAENPAITAWKIAGNNHGFRIRK